MRLGLVIVLGLVFCPLVPDSVGSGLSFTKAHLYKIQNNISIQLFDMFAVCYSENNIIHKVSLLPIL